MELTLLAVVVVIVSLVIGLVSWRQRADQRLRNLEVQLEKLLRHIGFEADPNPPVSDNVAALARTPGAKIAAIKAYREETGAGLKQAKDVIERLAEQPNNRYAEP
jgi:hypothetical protein